MQQLADGLTKPSAKYALACTLARGVHAWKFDQALGGKRRTRIGQEVGRRGHRTTAGQLQASRRQEEEETQTQRSGARPATVASSFP